MRETLGLNPPMRVTEFLTSEMCESVALLARAVQSGAANSSALATFIEESKRLPLTRIGNSEHAIRAITYQIGAPKKRPFWTQRQPAHDNAFMWFDLFSGDGYRRERVIRQTTEGAPNAFLLAVFLRRLNDWVPQVREAAREAAPLVLEKTAPNVLMDVLWVTLPVRTSWRRMSRVDGQVLDTAIEVSGVPEALVARLSTATAGRATSILRQAARQSTLDPFLSRLAESAIQPSVRAVSYRMLLEKCAVWPDGWHWQWIDKSLGRRIRKPTLAERPITTSIDHPAVLAAAVSDKSPLVRRVAGGILIANRDILGADELALARQLAADAYPSVASRGKFVLDHLAN